MSSTTIRYSTLPENSHSISLTSAHPPHRDEEPEPDTPGAYRHDPADLAATDPSLPDSDPRSPRYEPPHLRHRLGDTWEIGGRPHDPLDPGPYGSPGWYQDTRTGRHRRGELPDPVEPPPPVPAPSPPVDRARPSPYRRHRRWDTPAHVSEPREPRETHRFGESSGPSEPSDTGDDDTLYRFAPLREEAMRRFLELSQPFREAHFQPRPPSLAARLLWALRWLLWLAACGLLPAPRPLAAEQAPVLAVAATAADTGPSRLSGVPRQERPRASFAAQAPYTARWERHFDARFATGLSATGGGAL